MVDLDVLLFHLLADLAVYDDVVLEASSHAELPAAVPFTTLDCSSSSASQALCCVRCCADSAFHELRMPSGPAVGMLSASTGARTLSAAFERALFSNNTSLNAAGDTPVSQRGTVAIVGTGAFCIATFAACAFRDNNAADVLLVQRGEALAAPPLTQSAPNQQRNDTAIGGLDRFGPQYRLQLLKGTSATVVGIRKVWRFAARRADLHGGRIRRRHHMPLLCQRAQSSASVHLLAHCQCPMRTRHAEP
jgi:hypothetical protein